MAIKKAEATNIEAAKSKETGETKDSILNKLNSERIEKVAKQIWLAGLGASGRSFAELPNRYEKINTESQKMFDELVARGEKVQANAEDKLKEGKSDLEERIEKLKGYATFPGNSKVVDQLSEVNRKLDTLNKDVKKMA